MSHWWKDRKIVNQVTDWAFELDKKFPNQRLISLGQSPAWVIQGVNIIRRLKGEAANTSFIPFTGCHLKRDPDFVPERDGDICFTREESWYPPRERILKYFNFLGKINMQPQQVLDTIEKTGQDAVIVEMIRDGKGLASFLSVWLKSPEGEEAVRELGNKIKIFAYDTSQTANRDRIVFSCGNNICAPLEGRRLSSSEADTMLNLAACNIAEPDSDRLVAMYRLAANREDKGLEIPHNGAVVREIRGALHTSI